MPEAVPDPLPDAAVAPPPGTAAVRVATNADLGAVGRSLASAFADDPVWRHLVPGQQRWDRGAAGLFQVEAKNRLRHGHVYADQDCRAAAVWSPPGYWKTTPLEIARQLPAVRRLFGRTLFGALGTLTFIEKHHPNDRPHWYLAVLGTEPQSQGKGLGGAVLQPVLDRCDTEGLPAYLESSKEQNLGFYARHGFKASAPVTLPDGGPPFWPMWREPR